MIAPGKGELPEPPEGPPTPVEPPSEALDTELGALEAMLPDPAPDPAETDQAAPDPREGDPQNS
jgi:hypothetical protein